MAIPAPLFALVRRLVPIACVDALPYLPAERKVALARRAGPEGGRGWALIGGRVRRGETLEAALARHLRGSLGHEARWRRLPDLERPVHVAEYFPEPPAGKRRDPRQHAVALGYVVEVQDAPPPPRGADEEASWVPIDDLPPADEILFDHASVIDVLVGAIRDGAETR